jgi:uncharacterized protein
MIPRPAHASALYVGETVHSRWKPAVNRFVYSLFMAYVDLAELESGVLDCWPVFSTTTPWSITSLLPRDHFFANNAKGPPYNLAADLSPLGDRVRAVVEAHAGRRPDGPIRLLAGLRVLGLEFNPVSFYYVLDQTETRVDFLVAEVNNIPWFEQHIYVLSPASESAPKVVESSGGGSGGSTTAEADRLQIGGEACTRFSSHDKAFHVSPFMPIDNIKYNWLVGLPSQNLRLRIGLKQGSEDFFMASLNMRRRPFSLLQIVWVLFTYPFMTIKVIAGIMYEAAKLWKHGSFAFYSHPGGAETVSSKAIAHCVSTLLYLQNTFRRSCNSNSE